MPASLPAPVMLRVSVKEGFPKPDTLEKVSRGARLSVRQASEDRILLSERATARGMPSAQTIAAHRYGDRSFRGRI